MKTTPAALTLMVGFGLAATANAENAVVTFDNGWEGWTGSGAAIMPDGGNPGAHAHTQLTNFGIEYKTDSHPGFLGDYTQYESVTLSIDVKVNAIDFYGTPVSRNLILDLRSYDHGQGGYFWSSVWYNLSPIEGGLDWATYEITFDPQATEMPDGWGGTGYEDPDTYEPMLPPGVTFGDIMTSIQEVSFSTYEPGYMYSVNTYFDVQVDNIAIDAIPIPAPASAGLLGAGGLLAARRRR
jgi:hypothetical protein